MQHKLTNHRRTRAAIAALATLLAFGCGDDKDDQKGEGAKGKPAYALASIVINPDGERTTYLQAVHALEDGPFDNKQAIEMPGNGTLLAGAGHVFAGLVEEPTWVRYTASASGALEETGRLSLAGQGATSIDYGNAIVDEETAVSVLSQLAIAVIWNPSTMEVVGEVDLGHLVQEGYELEVWTTIAHEGLVYIPGRWADWEGARVRNGVSLTILDPKKRKLVGVAEDDRCASGGRVVFDDKGYGYVMGDGRTYSIQMFAHAAGEPVPENCLLRIAPGETDFEADYFHTIRSITGGLESISELETGAQGSGIAFAKMFYPDKLPDDVEPVDFTFWSLPVHKTWRIELGDEPSAKAVDGVPFSAIGFSGSSLNGRLYAGESPDGGKSEVYEVDPETNKATLKFEMDGYFNGLFAL